MTHWNSLRERFDTSGINFVIEPYTRYVDQPGEQETMFIKDPCGNHLEFKSFKDDSGIFDSEWGRP